MDCPCYDCLLIPACKNKTFSYLMKCIHIENYLNLRLPENLNDRRIEYSNRFNLMLDALKIEDAQTLCD
jgi:hypothetical protein